MFKNIHIKNFQSLKDVRVDLEPFTVIVGATDSGKSAFFRAISTLISNRRGSEFITYGEKICAITAELEQGTLKLQRGSATKDNFYEINRGDSTETYSKLSGTVPEEVSAFLRIPAKDPINLASQFDKPYLLDTKEYSAAESARILGALTNVNILFEGARESNRRKGEASTKLKTRISDAESVAEELQGYSNLEKKAEVLSKAEAAVNQAIQLETAIQHLKDLQDSVHTNRRLIQKLSSVAEAQIPDISAVEKLDAAKTLLSNTVREITNENSRIHRLTQVVETETQNIETLDAEYQDILRKEGTCPTCGQATG